MFQLRGFRWRAARAAVLAGTVLLVMLGLPGTAGAQQPAPAGSVSEQAPPVAVESYSIAGYEVWFAPTLGVFAGTGNGAQGELTAWYSSIEHSGVISPSGSITGGWATLHHGDGRRTSGWFDGGTVELVDPGAACTAETHVVKGSLTGLSRSGGLTAAVPAPAARGSFEATLVHHRAWLFGRCISYAASVEGTISLYP